MAQITQLETATPILQGLENRSGPNDPVMLLTHAGTIALDGAGVGDSADIQLTLPLPANMVWGLQACFGGLENVVDNKFVHDEWTNGQFRFNFVPFDQQVATRFDYPVLIEDENDPSMIPGGPEFAHLVFGAFEDNLGSSDWAIGMPWMSMPHRFMTQGLPNGGTNALLWLSTGSITNIDTNTSLRFAFVWNGYSVDDRFQSVLHTQNNVI